MKFRHILRSSTSTLRNVRPLDGFVLLLQRLTNDINHQRGRASFDHADPIACRQRTQETSGTSCRLGEMQESGRDNHWNGKLR